MKLIKTPRSIEIEITNECNLRCKYCYHFTGPGDVKEDITTDEWLGFFEELGRCAVMDVYIGGGEPFFRKDLKELIDGIVKNKMRFKLLSNGTLITDEIASYIASTGRCDHIQVSIDGGSPETHDLSRGKGNFHRAVKGIKILRKHQIPIAVRVTINRNNIRDLEEVAKLLLDDIGLPSFSTNSAGPMGLCKQNQEEMELTVEDRQIAMKNLLQLNEKYNGRIRAQAGPLAEARQWRMMEQARREGGAQLPNCGFLRGCGGIMDKMAVRADGVMTPCTQMSHIELGRINRDDLSEIWQHHPELKRLRERGSISLSTFEFCKGCEYIHYCTGNCPALAYATLKEDSHPSPDACLKRFLEAGGKVPE
jgi:SynChlorMet cassette radical SAM/SPASM protein ScmE